MNENNFIYAKFKLLCIPLLNITWPGYLCCDLADDLLNMLTKKVFKAFGTETGPQHDSSYTVQCAELAFFFTHIHNYVDLHKVFVTEKLNPCLTILKEMFRFKSSRF